MNLQRIKSLISKYKVWLSGTDSHENLYILESIQNFQNYFDLEASDLKEAYDQALQNTDSRRLWTMEAKFPKDMMMAFADMDADMVRWTFKDLFRHENTLDGRLNRFIFHCDEMYGVWKKQNPKAHHLGHYHEHNHWMSTVYLTLQSPDQYCLYTLNYLQALLQYVEAKNIPETEDPIRYYKVVKVLDKFISDDPEIEDLHQKRLKDEHFKGKSLFLAFECVLLSLKS